VKRIEQCIILHVEDDDACACLFLHSLGEADLHPTVYRVTNGEDASEFLAKGCAYADVPTPDLVLLDLNLPRKSGFEVLVDAKCKPDLAHVRFLVLSTSDEDRDRNRAIACGADGYLVKPINLDGFVQAAHSVCRAAAA
jgi:CheY-like chemotaxis protein